MRDGLLDSVRYINFCIYMLGQVVFDIVIDTRRRTKLKSGERRGIEARGRDVDLRSRDHSRLVCALLILRRSTRRFHGHRRDTDRYSQTHTLEAITTHAHSHQTIHALF